MDRKNRNVFLIFFLFSSLLFLSFEGFHLYLVNRTGTFLEDFARQRVRKSFEELEQTLLRHELFPSLFQNEARSELVWNHFYRELSRIERGFELKSLVLVDSIGKILLGTEVSRVFFEENHSNPLKLELPDSFFHRHKVVQLGGEQVGFIVAVFAVPFSQVIRLQENFLSLGFFFFLALLSAVLILARGLIKRLLTLEEESERSRRLAQFGSLAAGVAHDVRNPLGILGLQLQEMREMYEGDLESQDLLSKMGKEIKRIDHTVASLLVFGKESLPFDQIILIEDIIAEILGQEDLGNMELTVDVEPVRIEGNHDLIYRMLENLLRNSSEAAVDELVRIRITGKVLGSDLHLTVQDDGPGVEEPQKVFDEFFTTKKEGTGLGLLVVRDAVERHQGEGKCTSIPGDGTCFHIRLPIPNFSLH